MPAWEGKLLSSQDSDAEDQNSNCEANPDDHDRRDIAQGDFSGYEGSSPRSNSQDGF
jgi:hypothetical protein